MKKIYTIFFAMFLSYYAFAQTVTISNVVNESCNGQCIGSAMANQSGFVPAGTYSWNSTPTQTTQTATNLCAGSYTVTVTNGVQSATATVTITEPTMLTATESHVNVACFGGMNGSATAVASGGTPNYSYSWNSTPVQNTQTATNLGPGSYTCTVTDNNGCSTTVVSIITQPSSAVSATSSNTSVNCFGGSDGTATATPFGGTPPYSYSWNSTPAQMTQTATGLPMGTYACTITDANGCATSVATTIAQPSTAVMATTTSTSVSCNGGNDGSATVSASGGTPAYTYMWSPGNQTTTMINGLTAGTYTATVTDANGCMATSTVTVMQPNPLMANVTMINASCNGSCDGVAMANPTGGTSPFMYSWTSGGTAQNDSNLCAGNHGVVVTDANGCSTNQIFSITQPPVMTVTTSGTDATCVGCTNGSATATPTGGTGPYTYLWSPGSQTTQTASGLGLGTYTVCVTDANGCASVCDTVSINDGTGISTPSLSNGFFIYPNPASTVINIKTSVAGDLRITLYDITGKTIYSENFTCAKDAVHVLNIADQPAGIYLLQVQMNGTRITQKISKY
ncbi:MAG: T9SS type A sorting domain-containing protein [Bacteroidetes bacterium]|nr:T9SS type A sorting domain-containing protein [Bacteroidota bacterium]